MMIDLKNYISERLGDSISTHSELFKKAVYQMAKDQDVKIKIEARNEYLINIAIDASLYDKDKKMFKYESGEKIESFIKFLNYFYARQVDIEPRMRISKNAIVVQYEANKPSIIDYKDKYLYHCTNSLQIDSIIENGLRIKNNSIIIDHDQRIYCWGEQADKDTAKSFARMFIRIRQTNSHKNPYNRLTDNDIAVIKIDYEKMKEDGLDIKLYGDPQASGKYAMFMTDNIDPKYISIDRTWLN